MIEAARRARTGRRVFWCLVIWLMAWTTLVLDQLFTNTYPWPFFLGHLGSSTFGSFFLFLLLVPLGLIGRAVGNLRPFRRYRWWMSLVLPVAMCSWPVLSAIHQRIDPAVGFRRHFGAALPDTVRNVERDVNYVGFDLLATYSFECSRQDTERLILEFGLNPSEADSSGIAHSAAAGRLMTRITRWKNPRHDHSPFADSSGKFLEFWTDETFTRVIICRIDT